jgi:DNA-binding transcriptional ArsR family regulator
MEPLPHSDFLNLVCRAFRDPTRLRMLQMLRQGELSLHAIVAGTGVQQGRALTHLAYLHRAGLVAVDKVGHKKHFSLAPPQSESHRKVLDCLEFCLGGADHCPPNPAAAALPVGQPSSA